LTRGLSRRLEPKNSAKGRFSLRSYPRMSKVPFVYLLNLSDRNEARTLNKHGDRFLQLHLSVTLVDR